eukprot:Colp12_sorted_trinity150504_noHs@12779
MDNLPNQTLYINNINEKIKKEELKKALYAMFAQFGPILDIVALKTVKMRGQAFVVFQDVASATNAMRSMQGFPFFEKPIKIQFARGKSDAVAKIDGTFVPRDTPTRDKRKLAEEAAKVGNKPTKRQQLQAARAQGNGKEPPPNRILFLQGLPTLAPEDMQKMLGMLFNQFPGFKEARLVAGRPEIAFIEFENETLAGQAKDTLQDFQVTPENKLIITYANR